VSSIRSRTLWLALALALAGLIALATSARHTLPQISGTVHVSGLHSPVTVVRDRWGVPHIYAGDEHDLFVAQGYVTAQDRLWQMLLRRQGARGRLSEWLGTRAALADGILSRQDFPTQAAAALPSFDEESRTTLEAYALGVNACVAMCPDPPELALLKLQGKVTQVPPWAATDSLALSQMMQWAQAQSSAIELRSALVSRLRPERASDLWPEGIKLAGPALPADPAVRQVLQLTGIPLMVGNVAASAPGLPSAWYMATLRSERITIAGATWPGLPGAVVDQKTLIPGPSPRQREERALPLVKYLLALPPQGWLQFRVHGMLRQWDYDLSGRTRLGNASAAVYEAWLWHLARDTFQDELGPDLFARYWATGFASAALARLADRPGDAWWDDLTTSQHETRDDLMRRAYAEALDHLGRHYGDLHTIWEWDTMHAAMFRHRLGEAWPVWWLDREVKLGGDAWFDPARPDDPLRPYAPVLVPSLQMWRDAEGQVWFVLAGGESGYPLSPHYADLLSPWARGVDVPLQDVARPQDLRDVEGVLVLTP